MNDIKTGGPAFPLHNHGTQTLGMHLSGMTLRDYFAAKWMQAYVANPETADITETELAQFSYEIADAMLAARSNT